MKKLIALVIVAMFALTAFAAVAENGTLTLATNVNFPPYEFYDDETGEPTGIDIEIAKAICEKIGYELEVVDIDFGAIIPALAAHTYDFSAAGMTVTEERKQSVQFTDTYATGIQAVIVPADCEAQRPQVPAHLRPACPALCLNSLPEGTSACTLPCM